MPRERRDDLGCKCPACLETGVHGDPGLPACRDAPGRGLAVLHLVLHASLPLAGMAFIGMSWLALVPLLGSAAAYLVNSFVLCPTCAYHHAGLRACGCYPKSVFPYLRYHGKRWGVRENLLGRGGVLLLTLGPSVAVLVYQGNGAGIVVLLCQAVVILFVTSIVACPSCRQRDVCALGRLAVAGIKRKDL